MFYLFVYHLLVYVEGNFSYRPSNLTVRFTVNNRVKPLIAGCMLRSVTHVAVQMTH